MKTTRLIKTILLFPFASLVCFATSYLFARILLKLNHGFGGGDMSAFVYWSALFAVSLLLPTVLFAILLRHARTINRTWLGILLGALAGLGWTYLNLVFLGPWFGAWSFNVLYCWIVGGVFGILTVAVIGRTSKPALS